MVKKQSAFTKILVRMAYIILLAIIILAIIKALKII